MIRAAIVGASGYVGGELLRLLLGHPSIDVTQITSESRAGQPAHLAHPNLRDRTTLRFCAPNELDSTDMLFLATPHGVASRRIDEFAQKADRIVDLSADFRLHDPECYARWYGHEHPCRDWLSRFVYGLPEIHREELRHTRYASGVGCNASVSLLALLPLYRRDLVRETIVDIKVGSSEGGSRPTIGSHHPERAGVVRTFRPTGHRHQAELLQELGLPTEAHRLHLTVTSVGIVRGALATCHCLLTKPLDLLELRRLYRTAYHDEPFIRLVQARSGVHRFPEPKILSGSNYCDIGFAVDPLGVRAVVVGAIDNLMKGAAGTAVQTMNLMCGLPETEGLEHPGLHPL
jgi:N-acetyl-gamma-glutamyl-phosphate/LysW-gamma-L-alpha-aminoadipyl-6-phosphate reductase